MIIITNQKGERKQMAQGPVLPYANEVGVLVWGFLTITNKARLFEQ